MSVSQLLALLLAASTLQDPAFIVPPGSNLDRYSSLMFLFDESFDCLPATRPGGGAVPRYERMRAVLAREMDEIREEIIRREGRDGIDRMIEAYEFETGNVDRVAGPCDLAAAARALPRLRGALHAMERRLGLTEGGSARRRSED